MYDRDYNLSMKHIFVRFGSFVSIVMCGLLVLSSVASAVTYPVRPSAQMVYDQDGKYYYVYYSPGTNYSDPRLKYIGDPAVLGYYTSRGRKAYAITNAERVTYTLHDHGLGIPCGQPVRTPDKKIYYMEPLQWPPGAQDQADPVFSYGENFGYYEQLLNLSPSYNALDAASRIIQKYGFTSITGLPIGSGLSAGTPIINCMIVNQSGTPDYYRVFRHRTPEGIEVERKMKINTPEMLSLWSNYNKNAIIMDITSLPNVGSVKMPPSLLARTITDPNVYFTDDEGYKVIIPTIESFKALGFNISDVTFVSQSTIDSTPTSSH